MWDTRSHPASISRLFEVAYLAGQYTDHEDLLHHDETCTCKNFHHETVTMNHGVGLMMKIFVTQGHGVLQIVL